MRRRNERNGPHSKLCAFGGELFLKMVAFNAPRRVKNFTRQSSRLDFPYAQFAGESAQINFELCTYEFLTRLSFKLLILRPVYFLVSMLLESFSPCTLSALNL